MAANDSREVMIEATPKEILDVIADVESSPDWSPQLHSVEVLETHKGGRPKLVRITIKAAGLTDNLEVEYTWGDNTVGAVLVKSRQLKAQSATYTLTPAGNKTKVRYDLEVDPLIPLPGFLVKRTLKGAMETATDGLRKQVLKLKKG